MGGGILLIESHSLSNLLSQVYSAYKWDLLAFVYHEDIWNDVGLAKHFIDWLKPQNDREISSICNLVKDKGSKNAVLTLALQNAFPNKWRKSTSKKSQYVLKECIQQIFSKENTLILEEYRHPDANLELDYFLPQYNIAFEYQVNK